MFMIIRYLTLSSRISQPLKSAVGEFINCVPLHLVDCPAHVEDHYVLVEGVRHSPWAD